MTQTLTSWFNQIPHRPVLVNASVVMRPEGTQDANQIRHETGSSRNRVILSFSSVLCFSLHLL